MAVRNIEPPFEIFHDDDGKALESGYIYIGTENLDPVTNPITVYWDAALTTPASQPIRTVAGYPSNGGVISMIYVSSNYSIEVQNRNQVEVYSSTSDTRFYTRGIPSVASYAALRALTGMATGDFVRLSSGTGIDGVFRYDSTQSATDNGGTIIEGWERVYDGAVNARWFGFDTTGSTNDLTAATNMWNYCLAAAKDMYFPAGIYNVDNANFPFKQSGTPSSLLDCKNITIFGDGPATTLQTTSVNGADVLQLNGLKNIHIKTLKITATISGSNDGSNAISVTNGFDNITILDVECKNLPSLDQGFPNGGKALTVQPSTTVNDCGSLVARLVADGCSNGFGYDLNLVTSATKNTSIDVNITARNCYIGALVSAAAASGALSTEMDLGVNIRGIFTDCQKDIEIGRAHGIKADAHIVTTKTAAARRLDPNGTAWVSTSTDVQSLNCVYAKNAILNIKGNKGACDYKAQIGGASAGSSGLNGATEFSKIYLDIAGTAATADINAVDSGGNSMSRCELKFTNATTSSAPSNFLGVAKLNHIKALGSYGNSLLSANIQFPSTQIKSSDVNVLDDYEEGTWTPILADTSLSDEGATYSSQVGSYTKIGDIVKVHCQLALTGLGTLTTSQAAHIIGLPYASHATAGYQFSLSLAFASGLSLSAAGFVTAWVPSNVSYIKLSKWLATSTTGVTNALISDISASGTLIIGGTYKVNP